MKKLSILSIVVVSCLMFTCSEDFLEQRPQGSVDEVALLNPKGIDAALVATYSRMLGDGGGWGSTLSNWVMGSIAGGDAYKGTEPTDQPPANEIERYETLPNNGYVSEKWNHMFKGVVQANRVIRMIEKTPNLTEKFKTEKTAEARFLRSLFYFELKRVFNKVPWIDETISENNPMLPNTEDIWLKIEADFQFAAENLPETQPEVGRPNKWAARAFLARTYMFQDKYQEAKPLLEDIIANGKTSNGKKYALPKSYYTNFNMETNNSEESIFSIQHSTLDGSNGHNAFPGQNLNFPHNSGPGGCCGFFQPSQNLVNAFVVDPNTLLPKLDTYNNQDLKNDEGVESNEAWTPDRTTPVDPRLDYSVGRRGIPFHDWGVHPGKAWVRMQEYGGPYSPKKYVHRKSQQESLFEKYDGWAPGTAINYIIIRLADVILWAAEVEAQIGSLEKATEYVNMVRARAADPVNLEPFRLEDGTLAANYQVGLYPTFPNKEYAMKAIRMEHRLEFAMEGHRFFDLVRWGVAADWINNQYLPKEGQKRSQLFGAQFTAGKDEYFPIPENELRLNPNLRPNQAN
jgi:hypothetical protein